MKITTNHVPRFTIDAHELTDKERKEFGYLDWPAIDQGTDSATFFRYKGGLFDLGDFTRLDKGGDLNKAGWHGASCDTAFSATLVKLVGDDQVIVGYYYE